MLICQCRLDSNPELRLGDVTTVNWTVSEVILTVFLFGLRGEIIILIILLKGNENQTFSELLHFCLYSITGWSSA